MLPLVSKAGGAVWRVGQPATLRVLQSPIPQCWAGKGGQGQELSSLPPMGGVTRVPMGTSGSQQSHGSWEAAAWGPCKVAGFSASRGVLGKSQTMNPPRRKLSQARTPSVRWQGALSSNFLHQAHSPRKQRATQSEAPRGLSNQHRGQKRF